MNCLTTAWSLHQRELGNWARHKLRNSADADDFLQDLFLKVLRQGERFCSAQNARAWLFEVARNALADRLRVAPESSRCTVSSRAFQAGVDCEVPRH